MNLASNLVAGDRCPFCSQKNLVKFIKIFRFSFEESVLTCENPRCEFLFECDLSKVFFKHSTSSQEKSVSVDTRQPGEKDWFDELMNDLCTSDNIPPATNDCGNSLTQDIFDASNISSWISPNIIDLDTFSLNQFSHQNSINAPVDETVKSTFSDFPAPSYQNPSVSTSPIGSAIKIEKQASDAFLVHDFLNNNHIHKAISNGSSDFDFDKKLKQPCDKIEKNATKRINRMKFRKGQPLSDRISSQTGKIISAARALAKTNKPKTSKHLESQFKIYRPSSFGAPHQLPESKLFSGVTSFSPAAQKTRGVFPGSIRTEPTSPTGSDEVIISDESGASTSSTASSIGSAGTGVSSEIIRKQIRIDAIASRSSRLGSGFSGYHVNLNDYDAKRTNLSTKSCVGKATLSTKQLGDKLRTASSAVVKPTPRNRRPLKVEHLDA